MRGGVNPRRALPQSSSQPCKAKDITAQESGEKLGIANLVEGGSEPGKAPPITQRRVQAIAER